MNFDQFNEKSKLLINEAQNKAISLNHQQILPLHLLYSILDDKNDLIFDLLEFWSVQQTTETENRVFFPQSLIRNIVIYNWKNQDFECK